jgi:hypothetical protein
LTFIEKRGGAEVHMKSVALVILFLCACFGCLSEKKAKEGIDLTKNDGVFRITKDELPEGSFEIFYIDQEWFDERKNRIGNQIDLETFVKKHNIHSIVYNGNDKRKKYPNEIGILRVMCMRMNINLFVNLPLSRIPQMYYFWPVKSIESSRDKYPSDGKVMRGMDLTKKNSVIKIREDELPEGSFGIRDINQEWFDMIKNRIGNQNELEAFIIENKIHSIICYNKDLNEIGVLKEICIRKNINLFVNVPLSRILPIYSWRVKSIAKNR